MKLNLSCPQMGNTKTIEVDDEKKLLCFYDKRIGAEVPCDSLGPEWAGYVAKITGGNDKQGFPMMQGVLVNHRVRLLFKKGMPCFRERRKGSMKRKSVRGCVVASDLSALNLAVTKIGDETIEGFTDVARPNRLGPKRATKIRKMFNLSKEDDVRKYVVRRVIKEGKTKAPRITRLITKERLDRKAARRREKINRKERSKAMSKEYREVIKAYVAKRTAVKTKALERKEAAKKRALAKKGITYTKPERIAARKAKIAAAKEEQAAVKAAIKERAKAAALAKAAAAGKA